MYHHHPSKTFRKVAQAKPFSELPEQNLLASHPSKASRQITRAKPLGKLPKQSLSASCRRKISKRITLLKLFTRHLTKTFHKLTAKLFFMYHHHPSKTSRQVAQAKPFSELPEQNLSPYILSPLNTLRYLKPMQVFLSTPSY